MNVSWSRAVLFVELLFIAAPITMLLILGSSVYLPLAIRYPDLPSSAFSLLLLVNWLAVISGWALALSFLRGGAAGLRSCASWCWVLAALGAAIGLFALVSNHAPPSEEYSPMWQFRQDAGSLSLGLALVLPLCHLAFERRRIGA